MAWDNSVFDRAFDRIGLREEVVLADADPVKRCMAAFERPDEIDEAMQTHSTDYMIEFTTADAPWIVYHAELLIKRARYRVNQEPKAQGDGYWTQATLERVP